MKPGKPWKSTKQKCFFFTPGRHFSPQIRKTSVETPFLNWRCPTGC